MKERPITINFLHSATNSKFDCTRKLHTAKAYPLHNRMIIEGWKGAFFPKWSDWISPIYLSAMLFYNNHYCIRSCYCFFGFAWLDPVTLGTVCQGRYPSRCYQNIHWLHVLFSINLGSVFRQPNFHGDFLKYKCSWVVVYNNKWKLSFWVPNRTPKPSSHPTL